MWNEKPLEIPSPVFPGAELIMVRMAVDADDHAGMLQAAIGINQFCANSADPATTSSSIDIGGLREKASAIIAAPSTVAPIQITRPSPTTLRRVAR